MRLQLRIGKMLVCASACACALFILAPGRARAASTKIWLSDTASDFSAGEARGVAVGIDGSLVLSRDARRVEGISEATLFGIAADKSFTYVATGDSGRILRISAAGKVDTLATLSEKEVTAIAIGPDGAVYAAGSPGGNVYRIESGSPKLYYATKAKYVWALAFSGGNLFVGTGLPGEIHRVSAAGRGERIHAAADAHVRALFADKKGRVWAGTSGSGLILRIDPSGAVTTVYDSAKAEITAICASADGRVWAAAGSADSGGSGSGSEPISTPREVPAARASRTSGPEDGKDKAEVTVVVSTARLAPPASTGAKGGYSSEILLFDENEPPRTVWTSSMELVFALAPDTDSSSVLAATGPNGKLYRIAAGASALERTFDEKQVTAITAESVGTNSATAVYRLASGQRQGEWVSAVKDTGRMSRFGAFRWEGDEAPGTRVEFSFRSGESAAPDSTWSPWSALGPRKHEDLVAAPSARFLQIKIRMSSDGADRAATPIVRRLEASYRNRNAAPVVDALLALGPNEVFARSASGGSNVFETTSPDDKGIFTSLEESKSEGPPRHLLRKGYRTLTWRATDPDQDALLYEIEFRPVGSTRWLSLRKGLKENFYSFDTTSLPDGQYVFRLTASDGDANPDDKKTGSRESAPVLIDNTPPVIRKTAGGKGFEFEAVDAASPILGAEYSIDAKEWIRVEPKDGLSDSKTETYSIPVDPKSRGGFLLIRVTDAAHNVAAASFILASAN